MKYINKKLSIEKTDFQKIGNKFGTPLYCYSFSKLKENVNNFKKNFKSFSPLICFAIKSNTYSNTFFIFFSNSFYFKNFTF